MVRIESTRVGPPDQAHESRRPAPARHGRATDRWASLAARGGSGHEIFFSIRFYYPFPFFLFERAGCQLAGRVSRGVGPGRADGHGCGLAGGWAVGPRRAVPMLLPPF